MAIIVEQKDKYHPQQQLQKMQMQPQKNTTIVIYIIVLLATTQILVLIVDLVVYPFINDDFRLIAFAVLQIYSIVIAGKLKKSKRKEKEDQALL
jgi:hypothetical protein